MKGEGMSKTTRYMATVFVAALLGVFLAGCSSQPAASSASAEASGSEASASASAQSAEPTTEELLAELSAIKGLEDCTSLTMTMNGEMKIDMNAMIAAAGVSASAASADASDEAASEDSQTSIPINSVAKYDMSGDAIKALVTSEAMGMTQDLYINGSDAVVVMGDEAYSATLDELNMSQYADAESLLKSQGGSIDAIKDSITEITKGAQDEGFVYTVKCDPEKFLALAGTDMSALEQFGDALKIDAVTMYYFVDADGNLSGTDIDMQSKGFTMQMNIVVTDVNATEVPDAPEPTAAYSDFVAQVNEAVQEEASAAADAA